MDDARHAADDAAIRTLLARVAHFADWQEDLERYLDLFTDDAVWEFPGDRRQQVEPTTVRGRDAIRADRRERRRSGFQGPGTDTHHLVTTVAVVLDGDVATADSYWLFVGDTTTAPVIRSIGRYQDRLRRTADGWRLAHRIITVG
ncbi:MAG TPA: nuclear transport factor 2 family protein [Acidimicrobiales bacterium]|nr:nuclear transport factor 2 family protein [Acidimicrobiales bacterium]